jgi:hypothetical protein
LLLPQVKSVSQEVAPVSQSLEDLLDLTLNTRRQRLLQKTAERAHTQQAIDDAHVDLERMQTKFSTEVRSLIHKAVEQANRHLGKRPERCEFRDISGYYTGPLYVGGSSCNPIAYELRADGEKVGETLLIELTHDGMIKASLGPLPTSVPEAHTARVDFGWCPVSLDVFDAACALDLVVRYIATITERWPFATSST